MRHRIFFLSFLLFTSISLFSQTLSLSEIMKGDEFIGNQPENHRWSIDGSTVYFDWNPKNEKGSSTYFWKKGMKSPEVFTGDETFTEQNFESQQEFEKHYYTKSGVLYVYDRKTKKHQKIIQSFISFVSYQPIAIVASAQYAHKNRFLVIPKLQ